MGETHTRAQQPKPWLAFLLTGALALVVVGSRANGQVPTTLSPGSAVTPFAIVVGTNEGGAKQQKLRFAESDARNIAELLTEVGRYEERNVETLIAPTVSELRRTIGGLRGELESLKARDEASQLFFYYSGHATAKALNLGNETLPLKDLREALSDLPTTLTLVVLDACQSGAFSRGKGAEPAEDFSYNSVAGLTTEGFAVMSSSSNDELSQESNELGASYFTHHLVVALRGAGDTDRDGRVTLDEAYSYAYNQTLRDTSATSIGGQHVTLERELTGHGAVPLTFPADADAVLEVDATMTGQFLVQQPEGGAVMGELTKVEGDALRLAFPAGEYEVGWRNGDAIKRCTVTLRPDTVTALSTGSCRRDMRRSGQSKGLRVYKDEALTETRIRTARAELSIGQAIHGAALGAEICYFASCNKPRSWAGVTLLGAGLGVTVSLVSTRDGLHPATAVAVNAGTLWGAASSFLLFGATSKYFADGTASTDADTRRLVGSLIGGQFAGMGLGVLADRYLRPTTGEVSASLGTGLWAGGLTALAWGAVRFDEGSNTRALLGATFAAAQLGLVGGYFLADRVEMSRSRVFVLHAGGILGGGLGALATFLIRGDEANGSAFLWAAAGGAVVGLGLTYFLTRNWDKPDVPIEMAFSPTKGGAFVQLRLTL